AGAGAVAGRPRAGDARILPDRRSRREETGDGTAAGLRHAPGRSGTRLAATGASEAAAVTAISRSDLRDVDGQRWPPAGEHASRRTGPRPCPAPQGRARHRHSTGNDTPRSERGLMAPRPIWIGSAGLYHGSRAPELPSTEDRRGTGALAAGGPGSAPPGWPPPPPWVEASDHPWMDRPRWSSTLQVNGLLLTATRCLHEDRGNPRSDVGRILALRCRPAFLSTTAARGEDLQRGRAPDVPRAEAPQI